MINIELMTEMDLDQVAELEKEIFTMPWSRKSFEDAIANEYVYAIVAKKDNRIAGYSITYITAMDADLADIATAPNFRKQGIASKLLAATYNEAISKNINEMFLDVRASNEKAINLYIKNGFERLDVRKNYYSNPKEDGIVMRKILEN